MADQQPPAQPPPPQQPPQWAPPPQQQPALGHAPARRVGSGRLLRSAAAAGRRDHRVDLADRAGHPVDPGWRRMRRRWRGHWWSWRSHHDENGTTIPGIGALGGAIAVIGIIVIIIGVLQIVGGAGALGGRGWGRWIGIVLSVIFVRLRHPRTLGLRWRAELSNGGTTSLVFRSILLVGYGFTAYAFLTASQYFSSAAEATRVRPFRFGRPQGRPNCF